MKIAGFVVTGRPKSIQSPTRAAWMARVREAAAYHFAGPLAGDDLSIWITYYYNLMPDFDTDNVSKPICDALNGLAYTDDHQLTERRVRRKSIKGSYTLEGADPALVAAIGRGQDFVYIEIGRIEAGGA